MRKKLRKEILRKIWHLNQIFIIFGYVTLRYYFSEKVATFGLMILLLTVMEIESIRLRWKIQIPDSFNILRKHERYHATGMLYVVLAIIVCFAVFDFRIALAALLMGVFGDFFSALIGIKYGKMRLKSGKSIEGFFAGFVSNMIVGGILFWEYPLIALTMACIASVVELFTYKLDDNLTVPIFAGFSGQIVVLILGINLVQFTNPLHDFYNFLF